VIGAPATTKGGTGSATEASAGAIDTIGSTATRVSGAGPDAAGTAIGTATGSLGSTGTAIGNLAAGGIAKSGISAPEEALPSRGVALVPLQPSQGAHLIARRVPDLRAHGTSPALRPGTSGPRRRRSS